MDKPILFSAPMVRATLREIEKPGTGKTQTRRILKQQPPDECSIRYMLGNESWLAPTERTPLRHAWEAWEGELYRSRPSIALCGVFEVKMRFVPGDRLWVRESLERANGEAVGYPADLTWLPNTPWEWKRDRLPSIHMPRRLSRITLTVTDVRVQRLQEISDVDALAEGILTLNRVGYLNGAPLYGLDEGIGHDTPVGAFNHLWRSINGDGSWAANPFVVAITFRPVLVNIDSVEARAA